MSSVPGDTSGLQLAPHPDRPGWLQWQLGKDEDNHFNREVMGEMMLRRDDDRHARLRMIPLKRHLNPMGTIHGGTIMALIDISLFTTWRVLADQPVGGAVTLELSNQFVGPGQLEQPLDAVGEIVRETGRLVFIRGQVEQEHGLIASFSGIVRKTGQ
ncbi:PaaI family thioesterase [Altericroceibacterium spongiae]|nr:PaaI family thioesterase [Altericroceibacterium spongiae]